MSHRTRHHYSPQLEALEERWAPSATQRPLADFLSQQGTTHVFNTALPELPDNIGWTTPSTVSNGHFALIDYSGKEAAFLLANYNIDLGTTVSGNVHERPLADGRAEVSVELDTKNALAWASTYVPGGQTDQELNTTNPLLFGYRAQDLVNNPSLKPALAGSHLQVVFDNTAPGAPLPDLVNAFILGNTSPGQELVSLSFRANAKGVVHDPTGQQHDQQGTLVVSQTGVLFRGANDPSRHDFGFTAEVVSIHPTTNGLSQSASPGSASCQSTVVGHPQQAATSPAAPSSAAHASDPGAVDAVFVNFPDGLADDPLASATGR